MIAPRLWSQIARRQARSPLWGKHVVVTRAAAQSDELLRLLAQRGALPLLYPCIAIAPPVDLAPLDAAVVRLANGAFDLLVLTSANAAEQIDARLTALGIRRPFAARPQIAAIGASTAHKAAHLWGVRSVLLPERADAESLAALPELRAGMRVLLPQSDRSAPALAAALTVRGLSVDAVTAYRTVTGTGGAALRPLLAAGRVDAVTFASPSAVHGFVERLAAEGLDARATDGVRVACIGPTTRRAAEAAGLAVHAMPPQPELGAWVASLEDCYRA